MSQVPSNSDNFLNQKLRADREGYLDQYLQRRSYYEKLYKRKEGVNKRTCTYVNLKDDFEKYLDTDNGDGLVPTEWMSRRDDTKRRRYDMDSCRQEEVKHERPVIKKDIKTSDEAIAQLLSKGSGRPHQSDDQPLHSSNGPDSSTDLYASPHALTLDLAVYDADAMVHIISFLNELVERSTFDDIQLLIRLVKRRRCNGLDGGIVQVALDRAIDRWLDLSVLGERESMHVEGSSKIC